MFDAAIKKDIKGVWIIGEDIVQTDPNSAHVVEAMNSLELLVVQEIFMSETAKLATVVLPGTTFLEKMEHLQTLREEYKELIELFHRCQEQNLMVLSLQI